MVESNSNIDTIRVSDSVEFPMEVRLFNLDIPGHQVIAIVDQQDEDILPIYELQNLLISRLGQIQIGETYHGPVNREETLGYYKQEPLYFSLKNRLIVKFDLNFNFEPFEISLENQINGQVLFQEISERIKRDPNTFYLYIEQEMKRIKISRNNTAIKWTHRVESILRTNMLRDGKTPISIALTAEKRVSMNIGGATTTAELKEYIDIAHKVPSDACKLIFKGDILADDDCLQDKGVVEGSEITCYRTNRARAENFILCYIDFASHQGDSKIQFSTTGKDWEIAEPGLCVEGMCENKECRAYGSRVIANQGFGVINPAWDRPKFRCPLCQKVITDVKFASNNCIFELHGDVFQDTKRVTVIKPRTVGNEYLRYDSTDEWAFLKIVTKNLYDTIPRCIVCKKPAEVNIVELKCNHKHVLHEACYKFVKDCFVCKVPMKS